MDRYTKRIALEVTTHKLRRAQIHLANVLNETQEPSVLQSALQIDSLIQEAQFELKKITNSLNVSSQAVLTRGEAATPLIVLNA